TPASADSDARSGADCPQLTSHNAAPATQSRAPGLLWGLPVTEVRIALTLEVGAQLGAESWDTRDDVSRCRGWSQIAGRQIARASHRRWWHSDCDRRIRPCTFGGDTWLS